MLCAPFQTVYFSVAYFLSFLNLINEHASPLDNLRFYARLSKRHLGGILLEKLIAIDLDGTTLNAQSLISPKPNKH